MAPSEHSASQGDRPRPRRIGFDESGNTGPDLLDREQPIFVLASIGLDEDKSALLLGSDRRSGEYHSVAARRTRAGRAATLEVIHALGSGPDNVKIAVMHKPFVATTKFVDLIVEPIAASLGLDLYHQGLHLAVSNFIHLTWPTSDPVGFEQLMATFIHWARWPTPLSSTALGLATSRMAQYAPDGIDLILKAAATALRDSPSTLVTSGDISDLDPAGPALVGLLHDWAAGSESLTVVHDDSCEITRWLPHLRRLSDPTQTAVEVQLWNGETLRYPLAVDEIALSPSERSAQIQLADLVAGAAAIAFGSLLTTPRKNRRAYAADLLQSPLRSWVTGASVWPSPDLAPEDLGAVPGQTDWVIDRLAGWGADVD